MNNQTMIELADGRAPEDMRRLIALARLYWRNAGGTPQTLDPAVTQWSLEVRAAYHMVHDVIAARVEPCRARHWVGMRLVTADVVNDLRNLEMHKTKGGPEAHVLSVYIGAELAVTCIDGYVVRAAM